MVGVKKIPIYLPYNGTGNTVPFPFVCHLISGRLPFLSVFKPFPFCPKGRKDLGSSVIVTELERELPSTVIEQQNGSRQFSDRDRARARVT